MSTIWNNGVVDDHFVCFEAACSFLVIALCMYGQYYKGSSMLAPRGSPLGRILEDWSMYFHYPMSKEVLVYYCNTIWPMSVVDCGESDPWMVP